MPTSLHLAHPVNPARLQLIFWHNLVSPHQAPFVRELADAGHDVLVVASEAMSEDRRRLGWAVPDLGPARLILEPDDEAVQRIVQSSDRNCVHLIAGARGTPLGKKAAIACRDAGRRMGIITESPDPRGIGGLLRWVKYTTERISLGRRFEFILAMGAKGVRWFHLCGYEKSRVFPFSYVTERQPHLPTHRREGPVRVLFVGQVIPRKGVDLLLRAIAKVPGCELAVIGEGPELAGMKDLAVKSGTADRVAWLGSMEATQIHGHMSEADLLVLPSREDGWGAVINESLMAGTPVVCSNACGAADLIRRGWLGTVFKAGSIRSLGTTLRQWVGRGSGTPAERSRIRDWAGCIEGPAIARYVEDVLDHVYNDAPRPEPPWRISST